MSLTSPVAAHPNTADAEALDRLVHFAVYKLFGEYTYHIPLKTEKHVTAIIAPNGSGKTICLRLIDALFAKRWSFFVEVEFDQVEFGFASGNSVNIRREGKPSETDDVSPQLGLLFTITGFSAQPILWRPGGIDARSATRFPLERYLHFLTRRGINQFSHDYTGVMYTFQEAVEAFYSSLPEQVRTSLYGEEPKALSTLIKNIDCHLIETQRLLILKDDDEGPYRPGRSQKSTLTISRKAQTLRAVISKELTAYAALSQSLDRSFPKRVIRRQTVFPQENLKARLHELDAKRLSLTEAGILDSEADDPVSLPEGQLEEAISRVLSVYAEDTQQKLNSLSKLLARIELFKELINQRFSVLVNQQLSVKQILVSKEKGFEIVFHDRRVPLEKLSSGEQHQLVLFFELLFELRENALILIDEPELSLHVAWQKKFISDLNRIIKLNQFDVILATHSPQLISRSTDLVVELGEVDDK